MACVTTGGGATITFDGAGIGRARSIGFFSETGSSVDNTDLSDGFVKMCPGDLVDFGSVDASVLWDNEAITGWGSATVHKKGTLVITFGDSPAVTQISGEAFVLSRAVGDHVNNQEVTANYTFMWTADANQPGIAPVP